MDFNDVEVPGGLYPLVILPLLLFCAIVWRMCPRVLGANAFYGASTAVAWTIMWTHLMLIFIDWGNELYGEPGQDPSDSFESLDTDGLKA